MGGIAQQSWRTRPQVSKSSTDETNAILAILADTWANAECELDYDGPFQLLVAAVLSAQCNPEVVNEVTPELFTRYPNARSLARGSLTAIGNVIRPCGFFRLKAKLIRDMAGALVTDHDGRVPHSPGALLRLPGMTRRVVHIVLGTGFGVASGVAVDTHVSRVSNRLGLSTAETVIEIERELGELVDAAHWVDLSNRLMWHGRRICHVKRPECERCPMVGRCPSAAGFLQRRHNAGGVR